ncbi:MAG TPA: Fe-S cluster assembly protein SufD [Gemmatimonadaceae bacterium]|nr:Fe-S cluster assembly protein SufD [Gemmatimonadaceae bacterium]
MTPATLDAGAMQAYLEDFETAMLNGEGADEPSWLRPVRRTAMDRFAALGFPTPKIEDWHFTSAAPIADRTFRLTEAAPAATAADVERVSFGAPDWSRLVFVNGRYAPALSATEHLPAGVRVIDLAQALREDAALLSEHLTAIADSTHTAFTALNTAFMRHGAVVHIAANLELSSPIHLLFITDGSAAGGVAHPRNLIVADHHSSATIIESYVSLGDTEYFTNAVTEVAVGDGAQLSHYKMQRESPRAFHVGTTEVRQERDSHYVSFSFATGAALSRTNIYTTLAGAGCGATLNGLYMGSGQQHVDHQTRIEHVAPSCFSRELYKGILDDTSHGVFNGKVYVHPEAQKTDGKQTNNNVLLSERARVDTKPQLEIYADDVKCTHGATVGRLDEVALFYMKSRGIGAEHARALLTYAFAADVIEQIDVAPVRETLERLTLERFL